MWRTRAAKWIGLQYAFYIGCSLFGVAYYYSFAEAMGLGSVAAAVGFAGFSLANGVFRPVYGYISEFIGRRRTMIYAYSGNVVFQLLALWMGELHNAPLFVICAVVSGGLSGANFPMTAAIVSDYYGENNNAINYGSIYAFKALGGSFAGGIAALIMTGTLYGAATFHWERGFFFGAALAAIATVVVYFKCKAPTREQWERAMAKTPPVASRQGISRAA
jgi:MFS transporter, OFA family, oxalate/formate antiporter